MAGQGERWEPDAVRYTGKREMALGVRSEIPQYAARAGVAFDVIPPAWNALAADGAWVDGSVPDPASFALIPGGLISLRGTFSGGAATSRISILPVGCRPKVPRIIAAMAYHQPTLTWYPAFISIDQFGNIFAPWATSGFVAGDTISLDGVLFPAEQ